MDILQRDAVVKPLQLLESLSPLSIHGGITLILSDMRNDEVHPIDC